MDQVAREVRERLTIEAEQRQRHEEEIERHEIEEEQRQLENKKRWLSLRPDLNQQQQQTTSNGVMDGGVKPVFGRGRGRGAPTQQTLRRPGDRSDANSPTNFNTNNMNNNSMSNNVSSNNNGNNNNNGTATTTTTRRPFGRGTKMYMGSG